MQNSGITLRFDYPHELVIKLTLLENKVTFPIIVLYLFLYQNGCVWNCGQNWLDTFNLSFVVPFDKNTNQVAHYEMDHLDFKESEKPSTNLTH